VGSFGGHRRYLGTRRQAMSHRLTGRDTVSSTRGRRAHSPPIKAAQFGAGFLLGRRMPIRGDGSSPLARNACWLFWHQRIAREIVTEG
jgi:hypothetical protein